MAMKYKNVYQVQKIGRLAKRKQGPTDANVMIKIDSSQGIEFQFSTRASTKVKIQKDLRKLDIKKNSKSVYIPPKEIISATENFLALYDEYHIAFEETYADLCRLLLLPVKKGPKSKIQNTLTKLFESAIEGKVVLENNLFYLKKPGDGAYEMGLVAEGYRKFATILQLLQNGALNKDSILYWDEAESNINPRQIKIAAQIIKLLSELGVQIFISTHSYFLIKELSLLARNKDRKDDIKFISLFREAGIVVFEESYDPEDLNNNVILDEFLELYDREHENFYGN